MPELCQEEHDCPYAICASNMWTWIVISVFVAWLAGYMHHYFATKPEADMCQAMIPQVVQIRYMADELKERASRLSTLVNAVAEDRVWQALETFKNSPELKREFRDRYRTVRKGGHND